MIKKLKNVHIKAELVNSYNPSNITIEGDFYESVIKDMKENIGRDFVIICGNTSFNLKLFSAIIFKEVSEVKEYE